MVPTATENAPYEPPIAYLHQLACLRLQATQRHEERLTLMHQLPGDHSIEECHKLRIQESNCVETAVLQKLLDLGE